MDYEVFSVRPAASRPTSRATLPADREHVTSYLHQNRPGTSGCSISRGQGGGSQYRLTLDTEDDRQLLTRLIEDFAATTLNCADLVALLAAHPELAALNAHIEQKKLGE